MASFFYPLLLGRLSGIADVMSALRQGGGIAFRHTPSVKRALTAFGVAQAAIMTVSALYGAIRAASRAYKAYKKDTKTCRLQAALYFPGALSTVAISLSMLVQKIATLAENTKIGTRAGNLMLTSSVIFSGFYSAAAIVELDSEEKFSRELQAKKDSLDQMIAFVQEQQANFPNEFTRQTNAKCRDRVDAFSKKTSANETEKKKLLRRVFKANYRAKIRSNCLLGNSTYGFFNSAVGFFSSGIAIPIVHGIGALGLLAGDSPWLSNQVEAWFWNQRRCKILPKNCQKETDQETGEAKFWIRTAFAIAAAPIWVVPTVVYQEGKGFFCKN